MLARANLFYLAAFSTVAALAIPAVSNAEEFQDVHECDRYAAHPSDPHRWAAGVEDSQIIPGPAVTFCRAAVDEHPGTPRFAFQLGRSLWAANQIHEGTAVFLTLKETFEYGPAYAYLADAYMYGLGSIETDKEKAVAFYQIAANKGFSPAADILFALSRPDDTAERAFSIGDDTRVLKQPKERIMSPQHAIAKQGVTFDPNQYTQPEMVGALYSGNLSHLNPQGVGKTNYAGISNAHIYVASFHNEFSGTVNLKDQACVTLYDPRVTKRLDAKVVRLMTGGPGHDLESSLNQASQRGWAMMEELLTDMSKGGLGSWVDTQQNLYHLGENGGIDAARLIARHGCQSETARRVYANIRAYAFGHEALLSPEEQERQQRVKAQEAQDAKRARQKSLRTNAAASCLAQWEIEPMCLCMVEALDELQITEEEWKMIGSEFKNVVSLSRRYEGLREDLRTCRR